MSQAVLAVLVSGTFFTVLALSLSGVIPVWMRVDESIRTTAAQYFFILYLPMLPRAASIIFGAVLRAAGDTKSPMKIGVLITIDLWRHPMVSPRGQSLKPDMRDRAQYAAVCTVPDLLHPRVVESAA